MDYIYVLYIQCPSEHFVDNRYFRRIPFNCLVGVVDLEVPGYIWYSLCPPASFDRLVSSGYSFEPLEVE